MLELDVHLSRNGFQLDVQCVLREPVVGVFGPSGAGKSTLLHIIAGMAREASGLVRLDGRHVLDTDRKLNVPAHKRQVGLAFQDNRLFPHLSVAENLRYAAKEISTDSGRIHFKEVVELLRLEPLLKRRPEGLSGGEKRRVALGRVLLSNPALLLLDEPFSGLELEFRREILAFLREAQRRLKLPTLIVSHEMEEILSLTEHLLVLDRGTVVGCGRYFELMQDSALVNVIGVPALTNVLHTAIEWTDAEQRLTFCRPLLGPSETTIIAGGGRLPVLKVPLIDRPAGTPIYLILHPRDIALSRRPLADVSIQNQITGRIIKIVRSVHRTLCLIDAGAKFFADLASHSVHDLNLAEGSAVWCFFKAEDLRWA